MSTRMPIRVAADVSALADHRATAGIGRYINSLIAELRRREDIKLLAIRPPWPPLKESWALRFASAQALVAPGALAHRAAIVHAMASAPVLLWPLKRQVVTLHDVVPWTGTPRPGVTGRYLALQSHRLRGAGAVIAVSQVTADEAVEVLQLDRARVHVVPEATSNVFAAVEQPADAGRRRAAGVPDTPYLVWVGSMRAHDPRKGLDGLLDALTASNHHQTPLVLAGACGPESDRLEAAALARGLRVVLPGFVDDDTLAALYRGAAAAVVPSHHEGFGLPALEALASGTALVAARSANLPALVGDAAVLVPPGDDAALAAAIDSVLGDPVVAARLRSRGPEVAAAYSWRHTADLTVQVYRELVDSL